MIQIQTPVCSAWASGVVKGPHECAEHKPNSFMVKSLPPGTPTTPKKCAELLQISFFGPRRVENTNIFRLASTFGNSYLSAYLHDFAWHLSKWAPKRRYLGLLHMLGHLMVAGCIGLHRHSVSRCCLIFHLKCFP